MHSVIAWFAKNPVAANLLMFVSNGDRVLVVDNENKLHYRDIDLCAPKHKSIWRAVWFT